MKSTRKAKLDKFINKWASRKLLVFVVASSALFSGHLSAAEWITISIVYVGVQGASDVVERFKNKH